VSSYNAEARRAAGRLHTMVTPEFTPVHPPAMLRVHCSHSARGFPMIAGIPSTPRRHRSVHPSESECTSQVRQLEKLDEGGEVAVKGPSASVVFEPEPEPTAPAPSPPPAAAAAAGAGAAAAAAAVTPEEKKAVRLALPHGPGSRSSRCSWFA
jgi:hypothetical protein